MNVNILHIIFLVSAIIGFSSDAAITISNVVCQQQYPWNGKVNIEYEVYGGPEDTNIWISAIGYDKSNNKEFSIIALSGDGIEKSIKPGKHHLIWDAHKDYPNLKTDSFAIALKNCPQYMIVDFESGVISYCGTAPSEGWSSEYKTTKMVLRFIHPGTFIMGSPDNERGRRSTEVQRQVTLTRGFYIGVFETTQKQYELVMGFNPSKYKLEEDNPVESVSYNDLRGADANWPASSEVTPDSFFGKLRTKTGHSFDLPTEAQWEYACRAGTTTALNSGKNLSDETACSEMNEVGRYSGNKGDGGHAVVGSYLPNSWGLYDMHGNVWEWCLDWLALNLGTDPVTDPKGPTRGDSYQNYRVLKGGGFDVDANQCRSARRSGAIFNGVGPGVGFRIALPQ